MNLLNICALFFLLSLPSLGWANDKVVNVYGWNNEIPEFLFRKFTKESGIKVNFSTTPNNEILYAKLRAAKNAGYDVIMPSSYFVDRMRRQGMLEHLDKSQLPNLNHLDPVFSHPPYDPKIDYAVPFVWGLTGIAINTDNYSTKTIKSWSNLWDKRFKNQVMLLDDIREVFSMALLSLHYSANDQDPAHIEAAFLKLKSLMQNIKVFSSETVASLLIDEDVNIGMAWNGDTFKAARENPAIQFIFPAEGFVIWVDNFSVVKQAPHKANAYAFINFMLRPDNAAYAAEHSHFPTTNLAAKKRLPAQIRNNTTIYPSSNTLKRGQYQTDLSDETLTLYEKYWEELKMSG
jgi:spermidine/putrescine transport system substrate-binding protein